MWVAQKWANPLQNAYSPASGKLALTAVTLPALLSVNKKATRTGMKGSLGIKRPTAVARTRKPPPTLMGLMGSTGINLKLNEESPLTLNNWPVLSLMPFTLTVSASTLMRMGIGELLKIRLLGTGG
jgi:hypothetical protein